MEIVTGLGKDNERYRFQHLFLFSYEKTWLKEKELEEKKDILALAINGFMVVAYTTGISCNAHCFCCTLALFFIFSFTSLSLSLSLFDPLPSPFISLSRSALFALSLPLSLTFSLSVSRSIPLSLFNFVLLPTPSSLFSSNPRIELALSINKCVLWILVHHQNRVQWRARYTKSLFIMK